jgi:hypothetical protein
VGQVRGKAGIREYTDDAVNEPQIKRVRELATATGDAGITEDQACIEVDLSNGVKLMRFVEKSLGNLHRPLSDGQLEDKFRDQAAMFLAPAQVEKLAGQAWRIDDLADVNDLIVGTCGS